MRPTTKRRIIILAASTVTLAALLTGTYEFRQYQINAKSLAYRAQGMEAFSHGDFAGALTPLSKYIERHQNDADALFAFGKARSRVEAPNNRHLSEAIQYYRRGLELQPDNLDAKHQLLDLYSTTGYNAETITLANELLQSNPKDISALRSKAKALASRSQFEEAFAASNQLNTLAPLDIEGQGLSLYLMSPWCLNKPADQILSRAKKNLDAHPNDPRFIMLQGLAYHCTLDNDSAKQWYIKAAAHPSPDPEFVKICTRLMDEVGLFDKSEDLLARASADGHDPRMTRMLVQRLWQNGRFPQVIDRLKDLSPTDGSADTHLLAYKAFSLFNLQRDADARPIVEALASRKDDDAALAWAKALTARFESPNLNPREKITEFQSALVRDPSNSAIRYMMGEAYTQLGETELALQSWNQVIKDVPSWSAPRVQVAYLLASTGRSQTAVEQAQQAYASGQNLGSAIGLVVALATELDSPDASQHPDPANVLSLATEIQQKVPAEPQTLPIYVSLLARTGDKSKAISVINDTLSKNYPIGTDACLRLASVSRAQHLGLEQTILDHAEKSYGPTPPLLLASSMLLADAGHPDQGLQHLNDAASKSTTDIPLWQTALAQYLQHTNDPKSHDTWVALGDRFPLNLSIQSTILDLPDSSTAWHDRPFIERTIQRLHSLTGDQGFHWQLARCRWLLTSPNTQRDSAEAVVTLSEIVRTSPGLVIPRLYLAQAMQNVGNNSAATEQLRAAADADQNNPSVNLDLVRLLQADGKFTDARTYLDRAARSANTPAARQRVALYYARQGDLDSAAKILSPDTATDPAAASLLADFDRRKGNFDSASKLYTQLLTRPDLDPATIASAADFFASHNKMDTAHAALDHLSTSKLSPGHRELLLAQFTEKHGSKDAASSLYQQSVAAAPTDPELWRALIAYQLQQNQFDQAAASCDAATAKIPSDPQFAQIKSQALALRGNNGVVDTDMLAASIANDPTKSAAARASLSAYNDTRKNNDSPDRAVQKMRRVADDYPHFLPVQAQVVRMYLQQGRVTDAIAVASRAMDNFPNDPEPASLATIVYASAGRWNDVLSAAAEWRSRSLENPIQPDIALARAHLALNEPSDALTILKPYLGSARQSPDADNMLIGTYAEALIASNRIPDAYALLTPYLSRSEDWTISTLRLAPTIHNVAAASKWIEQTAPSIKPDSLKGQYEIANAWYLTALHLHDAALLQNAHVVVTPLTTRSDATASVMLLAASIDENLPTPNPDAAIAAYRRALHLDPKQPVAQNNLAYLLLTKGSDLDEARQLAEQAVAAAPADANYYDTLARVYAKTGKRDRAIATFQKVLDLQPDNAPAMVPMIRLLHDDGQLQAARAMMSKLETLLQANPKLQTPDMDLQSLRQQL
jgi:tetratricopeptide (TPR) repeat protein